jgi:CRISPR-associated protein Cas2
MSHALTVIITRDVEPRYRGLFRSAMLEVAAGIYISANFNREARDRLWEIISRWHKALNRGSVIMIWRDRSSVADIGLKTLGKTTRGYAEIDGLLLTRLRS